MSNKRTIESLKATIPVGGPCQVHSFGCWYPGTVKGYGRTRIEVQYATGGGPRVKKVDAGHVVPAGTYNLGVKGQPEPQSAFGIKIALERIKAVWGGETIVYRGAPITQGQAVDWAKEAGAEEDEIAKAIEAAPGAVK
jgi:hypothetical protein